MTDDVLSKLKSAGLLSEQTLDLGFVPSGSYALNKVMGGSYKSGFPIGYITQFCGQSSTAKTVFITEGLAQAQKLGYHTILIDAENAFNAEFAQVLGIDPDKLIYAAPPTLEECFDVMENLIKEIRELDSDTPIVIGYDSISVSPIKKELEADSFQQNNMLGALRALMTGMCLRRLNPILREQNVALLVVNQLREKVGITFGDVQTPAAGGKSLPFYLGVEMRTTAAAGDRILDENKEVIGIRGKVRNTKNKVALPFKTAEFELVFNKGLNPLYGLLPSLVMDGHVSYSKPWYTLVQDGTKFQKSGFEQLLSEADNWSTIRKIVGIEQ